MSEQGKPPERPPRSIPGITEMRGVAHSAPRDQHVLITGDADMPRRSSARFLAILFIGSTLLIAVLFVLLW